MSLRVLYAAAAVLLAAPAGGRAQSVPQCGGVSLQASYLAEEKPGGGPGFLLEIRNRGNAPIAIVDPVPLSVHWYAASGEHWLWRASSGSGGSLVNALREGGPLFAEQQPPNSPELATRTIPPYGSYSWTVFSGDTAGLRYQPGCEHCTYAGERQFRAVLAYAYLPASANRTPGLLRCGLRSGPVVMPPLPNSPNPHNSSTQ